MRATIQSASRNGARSVASRPNREVLARKDLEALRGNPYSDEEWAAAKHRLVALARLVRRWVAKAALMLSRLICRRLLGRCLSVDVMQNAAKADVGSIAHLRDLRPCFV